MRPVHALVLVCLVLIAVSGCRNGHRAWSNNPLGLGGATIAPPPTGSYKVDGSDPYYGTTIPSMPSAGNTTVPAQPASSLSPGWQPANQNGGTQNGGGQNGGGQNGNNQVPAQPASNQTSQVIPARGAQIPMNNVVSSTQTSMLRPSDQVTTRFSSNSQADQQPQLANANLGGGMQVNDATNAGPIPRNPQGNWNQLNGPAGSGTRSIQGSYQYAVRPSRSGNNALQYPYNTDGSVITQSTSTASYNANANGGWQAQSESQNFN